MKELRFEYPDSLGPFQIDLRVKAGQRIKAGTIVALVEFETISQELDAPESFTLRGIRRIARGFILEVDEETRDG